MSASRPRADRPHVGGHKPGREALSKPGPHRVVIVGAGFGGLFATKFLRRAPVEVTLLDRTNHHLFQPLLYQVATGILSSGQIAPSIREVLRHQRNARVELADVHDFDLERREVLANKVDGSELTIPYDSLIVSAGAGQSYFGHDEFADFAPGLKSIDDALEVRGRVFGAFEMAELEEDLEKRGEWLTFVVVGGGPTGVEIAGQIAELSHRTLRDNFRRIDPTSTRVLLFDGGKEILASFGDRLSAHGRGELERLGVEVHSGSIVTDVDRYGVEVKGPDGSTQRHASRTKVWAAGVQTSPLAARLAEASGATLEHSGRVGVEPDCSLRGHPEVYAVGDMMGGDLPGVAEVAMQSGVHAAVSIKRRLEGEPTKPFTYRDLGSMAMISRFRAIVSFKGIRLSGVIAWLAWLTVHLTFLTGFKNRFVTVIHWSISLIGRSRTERAISGQQVAARLALEEVGGTTEALEEAGERPEAGK